MVLIGETLKKLINNNFWNNFQNGVEHEIVENDSNQQSE